jgi:hypothetical protein
MQIITGLTSAAKQSISVPLPDGTSTSVYIEYRPQQLGWFYDIAYSAGVIAFQSKGNRLCPSPNMLRQHRAILPFGISCLTAGNVEPTTQTVFSDGTVTLLLLDASDIATIESTVYPGANT